MTRSKTIRTILSLAIAAPLMAAPLTVSATPQHCPPGHAKKGLCSPGARYDNKDTRRRVEYRYISDYERYGLKRPRDGYVYAVRNDELFLIVRATQEVIEGLGALSFLLNRGG
ncbi:MAG: hypothetical protein ACPG4X_12190 [Pikeienuella sp.]